MSHDGSGSRDRAEEAFHAFLELRRSGRSPDVEVFAAGLDEPVRGMFRSVLQDYEALRAAARSSPTAAAPDTPPIEFGDFRLLRELGRGGMGVVWEAEQLSLGRHVALKLLHPHLGASPIWIERFHREARAAARLSHPGIVAVHAVGEQGGTPYIAQELVPGGRTLADLFRAQRGRELAVGWFRASAAIFADAADALHAAHRAGVIHRDVKPGNILLHAGRPRLADFGLARVEEELGISRTGELIGTPWYMSPEQVASRRLPVDARSDVFSLGASLYEALTMRPPFEGDTREQVIGKILLDDPPDPRRLRSRVPRELALVCLKALEKSPARRYPDAAEMATDLRRYLAGEPVRARPPSALARAGRWLRRHPTLGAVGVVAAGSFAVLALLFAEARAARAEAEREARTAGRVEAFLVELLGEMAPAASRGAPIQPAPLLARGAQRARIELAEEPEVRATVLLTLGRLTEQLGELDEAEALLREALALRRDHAPADQDERELEAMNQLAHVLTAQGRYEEAEELYRQAQDGHVRLFGAGSSEELENRGNLATLYWRLERFDEAEALARDSLAGVIAHWGEEHLHTLTARGNLAALLMARGSHEEAEPMMRGVLEERRRREGEDAPDVLSLQLQYATLMERLGRTAEARALHLHGLEACQRVYGAAHPTTAKAWHALGSLAFRGGDAEEAAARFRGAWEIRKEALRPDHPDTLISLNNLIHALHRLGRDAEALPLAEDLLVATPASDERKEGRRWLLDEVREAALPPD